MLQTACTLFQESLMVFNRQTHSKWRKTHPVIIFSFCLSIQTVLFTAPLTFCLRQILSQNSLCREFRKIHVQYRYLICEHPDNSAISLPVQFCFICEQTLSSIPPVLFKIPQLKLCVTLLSLLLPHTCRLKPEKSSLQHFGSQKLTMDSSVINHHALLKFKKHLHVYLVNPEMHVLTIFSLGEAVSVEKCPSLVQ